jgi:phage terminase small subunit
LWGVHATRGRDSMIGKLTLKQRKFIQAYIQSGNATQAAKDAGYECKTDAAYAEMGSRTVRKVEGTICEIMAEIGLDDAMLAQKALEGLNAMAVEVVKYKGEITGEKTYVDYPTRAKYLEIIAKMKGLLREKIEQKTSGTLRIQIKGRDYGNQPQGTNPAGGKG